MTIQAAAPDSEAGDDSEPDESEPVTDLFTITYKLNGGSFDGMTADIIEQYPGGTVISIHEAPTRDGYEFQYWKGSEYQPGDKYTVTGDHVFTAQWDKEDGSTPPSPGTGDRSRPGSWFALMMLSLAILAAAATVLKKNLPQNQ